MVLSYNMGGIMRFSDFKLINKNMLRISFVLLVINVIIIAMDFIFDAISLAKFIYIPMIFLAVSLVMIIFSLISELIRMLK